MYGVLEDPTLAFLERFKQGHLFTKDFLSEHLFTNIHLARPPPPLTFTTDSNRSR